jgi:MFS family permease
MSSEAGRRTGVFHGWWVVLVAVLAMFAATLTGGSGFSVFVLPMSLDLGWDRKTIAGALSLGTVLGAVTAPYFGRLVDRYGARVMLTACGVGLAVSLLPIAWVQTPFFFYLGYATARLIDMGILNTAVTAAVANWFVRLRGRALGLTMAGNAIGVAIVTPLAQWIIEGWGWRVAWFILAFVAVAILTPLAWLLVRRRPEDLGLHPDGDPVPRARLAGVAAGSVAAPLQVDWSLQAALRTRSYWLLVVSGSLTMFAIAGLSIHQVPFLIENGLDPLGAAWVVSVYGFTWFSGSVGWGMVVERVPARFALSAVYVVTGLCMLWVVQIRELAPALIYGMLYGLTNGGKETLDAVVWADYFGRASVGAIRGYSRPLIVGSGAAGGFLGGWVHDSLGSYVLAFSAFGGLAIVGGLLALLARPPVAART